MTIQTFFGKVTSLLFNTLSRFVLALLLRSKYLNFMGAVTIFSDFGAHENKVCHCFPLFPHLFAMICWEQMTWSHNFLSVEFSASFFTLLFYLHQEANQFLFTFCHKGGVICTYGVTDVSPGNLDSSVCFIQPRISHDVLCM